MRFSNLFRPVAIGLVAAALCLPGIVRAGSQCPSGGAEGSPECKAMCAKKEAALVEKLALTPERKAVVVPLVKELDTTFMTWQKTRMEILEQMKTAAKDPNTTDAQYNELWTKFTQAKMTFDTALAAIETKMTQQMTPAERVKVTVFEQHYMKHAMAKWMHNKHEMEEKEELEHEEAPKM